MNKIGFKETEEAAYIGISRNFLRQDRMNDCRTNLTPGPHFVKLARDTRYLKEDLDN